MKIQTKVIELKGHPYYMDLIAELEKLRPIIPNYDYNTNNIEEMKYKSARLSMFESMMSIINPKGA